MANSLDDIKPEILNKQLPDHWPEGTRGWGFVLKTLQSTFVQVESFNFNPGDHYLVVPVVLGVRMDPAHIPQAVVQDYAGVFTITDASGKTISEVHLQREVGDVWSATFHLWGKRVGNAHGTVGTKTPAQFIEAALVALTWHVAAKNG